MRFFQLVALAATLHGPVFGQEDLDCPSEEEHIEPLPPQSPSNTTKDLPTLVRELPTCALSCLEDAGTATDCKPSDLLCLCTEKDELLKSMGPCVMFSDCTHDQTQVLVGNSQAICDQIPTATQEQIAEISLTVEQMLASARPSPPKKDASPGKLMAPAGSLAVVGAAVAIAMLAL